MAGKIRKFFPGGNTCRGFYSFYNYIIKSDAKRIFIIKGGPGVGKSTFMRYIGNELLKKGYDVEYHCCSSDNNSLDSIVVPSLQIALIDGTSPHVVEPKNPGAVEEIINLGNYWDNKKMIANKEKIIKTNSKVSEMFDIAYISLKEAKIAHDEWEKYIIKSMQYNKINEITQNLLNEIFLNVKPQYKRQPDERHLFGSAITPNGIVNEYDSIFQDCNKLYVIKGYPGSGKSYIIESIFKTSIRFGYDTEIYHCAFDPLKLDAIYIPKTHIAVLSISPPIRINTNIIDKNSMIINLNNFINSKIMSEYQVEIRSSETRFWSSLDRGIRYLKEAKKIHDELEEYYISSMDFNSINDLKEKTLQRILKL
jgi:Cdc6-like AAA superfamily ATPase